MQPVGGRHWLSALLHTRLLQIGTAMTDVVERRKRGQDKAGGWAETVRTVVYAVLIALVVRTFAIEPFNIPSGSMIPTLLVGDYLFVSKFSYGYSRHSFPFSLGFFSGPHLPRPGARARRRGSVQVSRRPGPGAEPHRLHHAHCRPAGRSHPGHHRDPADQRQTGREDKDRRLCARRWRLQDCDALQRGAAQRPEPRDHRVPATTDRPTTRRSSWFPPTAIS